MKKIFVLLISIISIPSFAQDALKMGNKIVGGGLSFNMSDSEKDKPYWYNPSREDRYESTSFSFSPYYGRLYDDHTMVGVRLNLGNSDSKGEQLGDDRIDDLNLKTSSVAVGAFLRKYFPATDKFGFFLESGINISRGTSKVEDRSFRLDEDSTFVLSRHYLRDNTSYGASIDAEGGMYFFLIPRLSIETNFIQFVLSYTDSKNEYEDLIENQIEEGEGNSTNVRLNLINSFSFDKLFTINYYF